MLVLMKMKIVNKDMEGDNTVWKKMKVENRKWFQKMASQK